MPIKTGRDFEAEGAREPYQLKLENGTLVTFLDPEERSTEATFQFDTEEITDAKDILKMALGDDFDMAWAEIKTWPIRRTNALLEDVREYYTGATKSAAE
jgi:hypothetical protein